MNHQFGAKDAPFIRTPGSKNPIRKFNHLPPYFRGAMGRGMEKCRKKAVMLEFLNWCGRYLDPCIAPT
jgi:hypothetical protein